MMNSYISHLVLKFDITRTATSALKPPLTLASWTMSPRPPLVETALLLAAIYDSSSLSMRRARLIGSFIGWFLGSSRPGGFQSHCTHLIITKPLPYRARRWASWVSERHLTFRLCSSFVPTITMSGAGYAVGVHLGAMASYSRGRGDSIRQPGRSWLVLNSSKRTM